MKLGYNTNGFAFHRWQDTLAIIAELGYKSVALTVDHFCLNPYSENFNEEIINVRESLRKHQLSCVIETGARFLLDARFKHHPTLISSTANDRQERIAFLCCCVNIARQLDAEAVSFWSGTKPKEVDFDQAYFHLIEGCRQVNDYAELNNVKIGFEPEPGMLIETMSQFERLKEALPSENFGLTLDIGHLQCVEVAPISSFIETFSDLIYNIHIEDMVKDVHEHLRFGEGDIDFAPVMATLKQIGYQGGIHVELSRHSHMAPSVAKESIDFLRQFI